MTEPLPDLLSAALFQRDDAVLAAHRKSGRPPLAGQWLLPMTPVGRIETAEDALGRHLREQFGIDAGSPAFADTVYLEDPADGRRFVANIFRTQLGAGPMRFRADGEYDDVRWLAAGDLEQVWMPPPLRASLLKLLSEHEDGAPDPDWTIEAASAEAVPLAERAAAEPAPPEPPAPDNAAGWDAISKAYQEAYYGDRYEGAFMWNQGLSEHDVQLLDDMRGKRVLVLGCGGGQDAVALARMGAVAVGIDVSAQQIAYAKKHAAKQGAANASFVTGSVEDLSRFDDESFDAAVSAHALNYVERIEDALGETARVLRPGGMLAISVRHPMDAVLSGGGPYTVERSYWEPQHDWTWDFESGESAPFREWYWSVSRWFEMFGEAGFDVERIIEPREDGAGFPNAAEAARLPLIPFTIMFKARKR